MSNDKALIEYYYHLASQSFETGNYTQAASLYKQCYDLYENSDLYVFDKGLKNTAQDALRKYQAIKENHLNH
jgi:hypothetical protein